ncbi:MAG: hypothetical protein EBR82_41745 [Caulobacteraceae bacterium]|nr:hypothetical protein [Caulobacteraceae bacterium]
MTYTPEQMRDNAHKQDHFGQTMEKAGLGGDVPRAVAAQLRQGADAVERVGVLEGALHELHATVKGECPSLLDVDRGGSFVLFELLNAALNPAPQSKP